MKNKHRRALVLNADYMPLSIISWRRAIILSILHEEDINSGVDIIDFYKNDYIKGTHDKKYPIPAVVRSVRYIKKRKNNIPFSRKNVFIRDQMTCMYCGKVFPPEELTYDHVIPRAKWRRQNHKISPTSWNNIVTCCIKCNRKKDNKTPKEANMQLLKQPSEPNPYGFILGLQPWSKIPEEWLTYITPIYKNLVRKSK